MQSLRTASALLACGRSYDMSFLCAPLHPPVPSYVEERIEYGLLERFPASLLPVPPLDHCEHFAVVVLIENHALGLVAEGQAKQHHPSFTRWHSATTTCSPTSRSLSASSAAA